MAMDIDEAVATLAPASTGGSVRGADGKVTRRKLRRRSPKTTINVRALVCAVAEAF